MEDFPYKIFALRPVTPQWSHLLDQTQNSNFQDAFLIADWKESLLFLKEEFGNGFFKSCGINHPLVQLVSATGEQQVRSFVGWVNVLRTLKAEESNNYPVLLKKLRSQSRSRSEGMPFVEIARSYLQSGFQVQFPLEVDGQKNPDMRITFRKTGENFFIEVSRINDTNRRSVIHEQFSKICNANLNIGNDLPCAIKQHLFLNEDQLKSVISQMENLKSEAWNGKQLTHYESAEISMAFVHPEHHESLEQWCKDKSIDKGINGLSVEFNDTERLIRHEKIKLEARQIPKESMGVLYFPIQFLYMMCMDKLATIAAFEKELIPHPNIYGLVLYADVIQALPQPTLVDHAHIISVQQTISGAARYKMFIQNPTCSPTIEESTVLQIRTAICGL